MKGNQKIDWKTAAALVISSMIGTGLFISLGFQLIDIQNTWSIVLLWVLGGVFALIGAFTYAELGPNFDESGGDYIFLSKLMPPLVGYVYAWVSLTVGFMAPIAISVMAIKRLPNTNLFIVDNPLHLFCNLETVLKHSVRIVRVYF